MARHIRAALSIVMTTMLGCSAAPRPGDAMASHTKIDDMEGGINRIGWVPGMTRPGFWFSATDCSQADRIDPRPATPDQNPWSYAELPVPHETFPATMSFHASRLRTTTPLMGVWGANMGVAFAGNPTGDGATAGPADGGDGADPDGGVSTAGQPCKQGSALDYRGTSASNIGAYSGITFWAAAMSGAKTIRVQLNDVNTDPRGSICNRLEPISDANCYNGFGTSLALTETFTRYTVDFASLKQRASWGYHPPSGTVDVHVYSLVFEVDLPDCASAPDTMCAGGPPSVAFDFWIDDLYFVNK